MKLTKAEKELVLQNRRRLALDHHNWNLEPYVTDKQLEEMSCWRSLSLMSSTAFQRDHAMQVFRNTAHPDNKDWNTRQKALIVINQIDSRKPTS